VLAAPAPEAVVRHMDAKGIGFRWGAFHARHLDEVLQ
jgi:hypothetical protein